MVPGLIVAADTAFSSNRFAGARQIHKLDLYIELKEAVMNELHATQMLKSSCPVMLAPTDAGTRYACRFSGHRGLPR